MLDGPSRIGTSIAVLVATGVGWTVYEFTFRHYGSGNPSGTLLDASPEAAGAAAIAWIGTTAILAGLGLLIARRLRRIA